MKYQTSPDISAMRRVPFPLDRQSSSFSLPTAGTILCFFALMPIALSDMYFVDIGYPVLPPFGLIVLLVILLLFYNQRPHPPQRSKPLARILAIGMIIIFILNTSLSIFFNSGFTVKPVLGIFLGTTALLSILSKIQNSRFRAELLGSFNGVIVVHLCFFFYQIYHYFLTREFLDFLNPIAGLETRTDLSILSTPRFTGLFAEPANASIFFFQALVIRLIHSGFKFRILDGLSLLAMGLSLSLFGQMLIAALLFVYLLKTRSPWSGAIFLLVVWKLSSHVLESTGGFDYLQERTGKLYSDTDGSVNDRWIDPWLGFWEKRNDRLFIFGAGLGDEKSEDLPVRNNGLIYLVHYFGVVGIFFFGGLFILLLRQYEYTLVSFFFLGITLIGFAPFTNIFWWTWAGLLSFASYGRQTTKEKRGGYLSSKSFRLPSYLPNNDRVIMGQM